MTVSQQSTRHTNGSDAVFVATTGVKIDMLRCIVLYLMMEGHRGTLFLETFLRRDVSPSTRVIYIFNGERPSNS